MKISSTEAQNSFGKYLKIASELEDVIVTKNGKDLVKITYCGDPPVVREEALNHYYNREGKMSYLEFLELSANSDLRYEFIDGEIYCLTAPNRSHQFAVIKISTAFENWFDGKKCQPFTSPFDVTLKKNRENINVVQPDIMVICDMDNVDEKEKYLGVPALVVEVLSDSTRRKDLVKKMELYWDTGVHEYWVVDPVKKEIKLYTFAGEDMDDFLFTGDMTAKSVVFKGLEVSLSKVFLK